MVRWRQLTTRLGIVSMVVGLCAAVPLAAPPANPARAATATPIYQDPSYSFAERAADLVARLTPTQRASQLVSSQAPAITTAADPLLKETFGGQTTLTAPASASDTNVKVDSIKGMAVGAKLTIDPNSTTETVTV